MLYSHLKHKITNFLTTSLATLRKSLRKSLWIWYIFVQIFNVLCLFWITWTSNTLHLARYNRNLISSLITFSGKRKYYSLALGPFLWIIVIRCSKKFINIFVFLDQTKHCWSINSRLLIDISFNLLLKLYLWVISISSINLSILCQKCFFCSKLNRWSKTWRNFDVFDGESASWIIILISFSKNFGIFAKNVWNALGFDGRIIKILSNHLKTSLAPKKSKNNICARRNAYDAYIGSTYQPKVKYIDNFFSNFGYFWLGHHNLSI